MEREREREREKGEKRKNLLKGLQGFVVPKNSTLSF